LLIGRQREQSLLKRCVESNRSEFVAVYGRRRVGKTFLIKEFFESQFTFYATGILGGSRDAQLQVWNNEIARFGGANFTEAKNWIEAFSNLNLLIEKNLLKNERREKQVIFLDEVPWMSTMHSDFLAGLDYFWNRFASSRTDILLIVCGSAASWITDNIVNAKGGLHNRLTRHILVEPFSLKECEQYFESKKLPMTRYQMAEAYMIFGGIPYYLSLMNPQYSLYQNVDMLYFSRDAELQNEFENLYRSLYRNAEQYINVIETLAQKGIGLSRADIVSKSKISDGGALSKILKNLCISGFIREYRAYGKKKKDSLFQLVDPFSLFDIRFRDRRNEFSSDFWLRFSSTPSYHTWSGFSFEKLCLLHLTQIREKLGISGVLTSAFSWKGEAGNVGTQVDLVIDRGDNVINLCEIKFSSVPYSIDKKDSDSIRHKRAAFIASTKTKKFVQTTLITTFGLIQNMYSAEIVSEVALDDLFNS